MATDKKTEAPRTVEERLKTLFELQTLHTEIDRIRNIRGELPHEVEDLENTIKGLHTRIERYQGETEELRLKRTAEANKIENKKLLIERYKQQLDNVRNNHEFDKLTEEIEYETLQIELGEKIIGEIERSIDNRIADIQNTEQEINDQTHILNEKKDVLENIVSETRSEEENLLMRAKALEPLVDTRTLQAFKRIRKNAKNGLGIVVVDRNACGGCFNRIPPQRQIDIRTHKKVIVCEYCGRIMIDPELAAEVTAELQKK
ncbi:MAG: hypothetical protein K2I69_00845 [Muribaculaceae bacterium]|nr:hypothetical protein [Muribaculaceae bacterium]MDE6573777.1 hypothetical protein [Muribaculaceae bacterium]